MIKPAEPRRCRLACVGALTIYEAPAKKRELLEALDTTDVLELDLSAVEEMDTAGLQLILLACREAGRSHRTVTVIPTGDAATEVLELYGLRELLADANELPHADAAQEVKEP